MRNPKRIRVFCNKLADIWEEECPDWRFGQLIGNVFGGVDRFYTEEEDMIKLFETYFQRACPMGGDIANDCDGCAYSGDYHFANDGCRKRT